MADTRCQLVLVLFDVQTTARRMCPVVEPTAVNMTLPRAMEPIRLALRRGHADASSSGSVHSIPCPPRSRPAYYVSTLSSAEVPARDIAHLVRQQERCVPETADEAQQLRTGWLDGGLGG